MTDQIEISKDQSDTDWWSEQNGWTKPSEREHLDRPDWAYDEDGYCVSCFNGKWKAHSPYCELADLYERKYQS